MFFVLRENDLLKKELTPAIDYAIIPLDQSARKTSYQLADYFRADDKVVDVILANKKLGDLMKHAAKIAKFGVVVGENEIKSKTFKVKKFATGEQKDLKLK